MYLGILKQEEKENFLELCHYIASCDADFSSCEKSWISKRREEMNLQDYIVQNKSSDAVIGEFSETSFINKTLILLEILELMLLDSTYHQTEEEVVKKLCESWKISNEQFQDIVFWLKDKNVILKM